ncbi:MAG TPA: glycoside hydrolase family 172 protein [Bacteroidales bacterium]|nr:glycoside hydrolase family 172 protein [Bacteroidales bacterium]
MKKILAIIMITFYSAILFSQDFESEMYSLSKIRRDVKSKRISSFDNTGGNGDRLTGIADGSKATLMDVKGAGVINHIWITIAPDAATASRNDIILRMYWDGNSFPSVESPLGPFFGNGWNEAYDFISVPVTVAPGSGKSYISYFAMPFSNGARIEIENQTGAEIRAFYYYIDYVEMYQLPKNSGRFHAWYNREITEAHPPGTGKNVNGKNNYAFADITGKGQFVGVNYYINCPTTIWYGEGDDMIFLDGDTLPTLNGTGTEDFFNTSWSPKVLWQHPYNGYARVNNETGYLGRTHVYRFFIADPVFFDKSCKFTIEHGTNNNLALDLASVAYWYQDKASGLPRSFTKEERQPKPIIGPSQINMWRNTWSEDRGNDMKLWGNERKSQPQK